MAILDCERLHLTIGGKTVCRGLDMAVEAGQYWGVLGRNGVGKTTLLHALAGLCPTDGGTLHLHGRSLGQLSRKHIARKVGVLFQDVSEAFPASVLETALSGRHPYLDAWQWEGEDDVALARHALRAMELGAMERRQIDTLSGGERQRLNLAALLTQDPQLFFLDEPTNHLDLHHQVHVLTLFRQLAQERHKALLMTLHDVNLAARFCSHLLMLFGDGEVLHGVAADVLTAANLERLYGHPMRVLRDGGEQAYLPD